MTVRVKENFQAQISWFVSAIPGSMEEGEDELDLSSLSLDEAVSDELLVLSSVYSSDSDTGASPPVALLSRIALVSPSNLPQNFIPLHQTETEPGTMRRRYH